MVFTQNWQTHNLFIGIINTVVSFKKQHFFYVIVIITEQYYVIITDLQKAYYGI